MKAVGSFNRSGSDHPVTLCYNRPPPPSPKKNEVLNGEERSVLHNRECPELLSV